MASQDSIQNVSPSDESILKGSDQLIHEGFKPID